MKIMENKRSSGNDIRNTLDELYKIYYNTDSKVKKSQISKEIDTIVSQAYEVKPLLLFINRMRDKSFYSSIMKIINNEPIDDYEFYGFEGARFTSDGWNYCETEATVYEMAKEAGIETCFAKTEYVGDIDGYPVYSQERAEIFYFRKNESEYSEETRSKTRDKCRELNVESSINICWMTDFLAYYGEEMLKTFGAKDKED